MTTPISGPSASVSTVGQAKGETHLQAPEMGKDMFLKLLVAQLKYQDPTKPADSSQFMAQTAQFSMVEKLEEMAKQNTELLSSQRSMSASGMLGAEITYEALGGAEAKGTVTGVKFGPAGPILMIGDTEVSYSGVKEMRLPAPAGGTSTT
jgi:flagellar basal-body rod modification protein FlgD